ncbi:MAG: NUDIX domain-containing protein [Candidatus Moraniibacteriota bacterium]
MRLFGLPVVWETSVGAVVFRSEGAKRLYLLLHYPSGHYDFAKGHIEDGETEEMTLRRETEEETGITELKVSPRRVSISYFYTAKGNERARRISEKRGIWIFKTSIFIRPRLPKKRYAFPMSTVASSGSRTARRWRK